MSMANFDLIEYQKRVIADLTAENKALKEQIIGNCAFCKHRRVSPEKFPCLDCINCNEESKISHWEWKGVDEK